MGSAAMIVYAQSIYRTYTVAGSLHTDYCTQLLYTAVEAIKGNASTFDRSDTQSGEHVQLFHY